MATNPEIPDTPEELTKTSLQDNYSHEASRVLGYVWTMFAAFTLQLPPEDLCCILKNYVRKDASHQERHAIISTTYDVCLEWINKLKAVSDPHNGFIPVNDGDQLIQELIEELTPLLDGVAIKGDS